MKFKVIIDFKDASGAYEKDNVHNTEKCGMSEQRCADYHQAGFVCIEGKEAQPLLKENRPVRPDNVELASA